MSDSYEPILDRHFATQAVSNHFEDAVSLIKEFVNYGTFLIPRAFRSSPRDIKAVCLIFVQLHQFLTHLDGFALLLAAGNCLSSTLQIRSLLEISHSMEWILSADTDTKVNYLYTYNLRKRKHWNAALTPGTPEAARHADAVAMVSLTPIQMKEISDQTHNIDEILSRSPFDVINAKFEHHYSPNGYDKPWHEMYDGSSIRRIAKNLNREKEYSYIYSPYSGVTHASDMWKSLICNDQHIEVNPIREPGNIPHVVPIAGTFTLRVYRMILQEYRAGEVENFARKYLSDWRERFMKRYRVELFPRFTTI